MSTGDGMGMGLSLSGPEREPTTVLNEAIDPDAPRSRRYRPTTRSAPTCKLRAT